MSIKISILASGSSGNATYIETPQTRIIIDAGVSCSELKKRLELIDVSPESIQYIILTHEHIDHFSGAGPFSRYYDIPIIVHSETYSRLENKIGKIRERLFFDSDKTIKVGDLLLEPFSVSHDAIAPVGFCVHSNTSKIGIATDLGKTSKLVIEKLKNSDILILESNHDEDLLWEGPYPWYLKQRIRGNRGHLSNNQCNELIEEVWHDGIKHLFLAHLSEVNNLPELAKNSAVNKILEITNSENFCNTIKLTSQNSPTPLLET
jgi:phosphoribosyl 1,2-cyclic phosphodiesterase